MRILTILFLLMSIVTLGGKRSLENITIKFYEELKEKIRRRKTTEGIDDKFFSSCEYYSVMMAWSFVVLLPIALTKLFYLCFAISHDPFKYVVLGYLTYIVLSIFINSMTGKNKFNYKNLNKYSVEGAIEQLDKTIGKLSRFKITILIEKLISLSFYGYMFYIFFIR